MTDSQIGFVDPVSWVVLTKRILACAERLDWLAAEAEPELQQPLGVPPKD
jgi:hypothetical protein